MHSRIVIARPQGGRGNLAVPGGITGKPRRKRNCLPEIAPQGHFLALRAQGATSAVGLLAMTNLGALHVRHECLHLCSCQRRSLTAATDAIGACRFYRQLVRDDSAARGVEDAAPLQRLNDTGRSGLSRAARQHYWEFAVRSAFASLRSSFVRKKRSKTGMKNMHTNAAVKPPLYRQKPPCSRGTLVTSVKCSIPARMPNGQP